jgi:excisionase family DNA binding protein
LDNQRTDDVTEGEGERSMDKQPLPELYTVTEAAQALRMGRSTLYRLVRAGVVGYTPDPVGRVRFTREDIDAALEAGRRQAVA